MYTCFRDLHRAHKMAGRFDLTADLFDFRRGCMAAPDFDRCNDVFPQLIVLLRDCDVPMSNLGGSPVAPALYAFI